MSKQSEAVKIWRKRCKERIIIAMGGACCLCGYNKCHWALALHHLDPKEKDLAIGDIRANPQNWITIVEELRKCILVCHNCHSEIHAGLTSVPDNHPKFNEEFVDYKSLESEPEDLNPCPVCGKMKRAFLKNCSLDCARRSRYKVDWDSVNLEEEFKIKTVTKIAEELGCSGGAVHKRLNKLGLK